MWIYYTRGLQFLFSVYRVQWLLKPIICFCISSIACLFPQHNWCGLKPISAHCFSWPLQRHVQSSHRHWQHTHHQKAGPIQHRKLSFSKWYYRQHLRMNIVLGIANLCYFQASDLHQPALTEHGVSQKHSSSHPPLTQTNPLLFSAAVVSETTKITRQVSYKKKEGRVCSCISFSSFSGNGSALFIFKPFFLWFDFLKT